MFEKMRPWTYRNQLDKEKSIVNPELAIYESGIRRSYFESEIRESLRQAFETFTTSVYEIRPVGSTVDNAATAESDIDILIVLENGVSLQECQYVLYGAETIEDYFASRSEYPLHFWHVVHNPKRKTCRHEFVTSLNAPKTRSGIA